MARLRLAAAPFLGRARLMTTGLPSLFRMRLPPRILPRAFAAVSAALVRVDIIPASSSATATICRRNRPVAPWICGRSAKRTSTPASSKRRRKPDASCESVNLAHDKWTAVQIRKSYRLRRHRTRVLALLFWRRIAITLGGSSLLPLTCRSVSFVPRGPL